MQTLIGSKGLVEHMQILFHLTCYVQTMTNLYKDHPEIDMTGGRARGQDTFEHMSQAIFCLHAGGWGWSSRMKMAITRGCIPVIVQVGVLP